MYYSGSCITFKDIFGDVTRTPNNTNIGHKPYDKNSNFINIDPRKMKFISLDSSH